MDILDAVIHPSPNTSVRHLLTNLETALAKGDDDLAAAHAKQLAGLFFLSLLTIVFFYLL